MPTGGTDEGGGRERESGQKESPSLKRGEICQSSEKEEEEDEEREREINSKDDSEYCELCYSIEKNIASNERSL